MHLTKTRHADQAAGAVRNPFTYANVVSTLALFLVLAGGSAYAADHYLITKTSEIKPSVLKSLRGKAGLAGATGATGAIGATGATGGTGATGPSTGAAGGALAGNYPDPRLAALPAITAISTFYSGWSSYGTVDPVGYYVDGSGIVHLTGALKGGTTPGYAFFVPESLGADDSFSAADLSGAGTGNATACVVTIYTNGGLYVSAGCSNTYLSLEGITYRPTS